MRSLGICMLLIVLGCASSDPEYDRVERAKEAHALYQEAREELRKASIEVDVAMYRAAIEKYAEVLKIEPEFIKARTELGAALYALAQREEKRAAALNHQLHEAEDMGQNVEMEKKGAEFETAINEARDLYTLALDNLQLVEGTQPNSNVYWQISDIYFFFEDFRESHRYLLKALKSGETSEKSTQERLRGRLQLLEELIIRQELETSG